MPVEHDPVTQIVNVQWEEVEVGGFFAVPTEQIDEAQAINGKIFGGSVEPKEEAETDGAIDSSWTTVHQAVSAYRCQSYALVNGEQTHYDNGAIIEQGGKPTFLIGGKWTGSAEIKISHDGETWTTATSQPDLGGGTGFANIVWHPKDRAFYAISDILTNEGAYAQAQLWKSSDGNSWSKISEATAMTPEDYDVNIGPLEDQFLAYCTKPENLVNKGIPDGIAGFDYNTGMLMYPTGAGANPPTSSGATHGGFAGITVEVLAPTDDIPPDIIPTIQLPVEQIIGVAWAGGVWCAVGQDHPPIFGNTPVKMFASIDDGKTWEMVFETTAYSPYGIVGADNSDIEGTTA